MHTEDELFVEPRNDVTIPAAKRSNLLFPQQLVSECFTIYQQANSICFVGTRLGTPALTTSLTMRDNT